MAYAGRVPELFESPEAPTGRSTAPRSMSRRGRLGPSPGVVPGVAAVECLLARTDKVAISIGPAFVYPTGLEFRIAIDAADAETNLDPFGRRRPGRSSDTEDARPTPLLFGFRFADGSEVTTLGKGLGGAGDTEGRAPMLLPRSGSSYQGHWTQEYWLWPPPPPGRFEVVCEWAAAGIPLTRVELDAAEIDRARAGSKSIFPEDVEASS